MKSQVKSDHMQINNDYMGNIFEHNLKYLFKLTREKNNKKIIDFCKETGIGQSTITRWKNKNIIPTRTNLKIIADYFNQNLLLNIIPEYLIKNDLEIAALVVKLSLIHI